MDFNSIILAAEEVVQAAADAGHADEQAGGVLGTLGINWKIFIAQLVNFLIVLFVLWKWVLGPITKTLGERQDKIEQGIKNAQTMEEERVKFEQWKGEEIKKARTDAEAILTSANDMASKLKQQTQAEAQAQGERIIKQAEAAIQMEKDQTLKEIREETATLVVAAAEKILRSKLDSKTDQELIKKSLKQ